MSTVAMGDAGHRGDYGEQFVQALGIAANLDVSKSKFRDRMGVDWHLSHPGHSGTVRFPSIEVQVKCWSPEDKNYGDAWRYPLRVHNYNMLAGPDWQTPRFLFLVIAPSSYEDWVYVDEERLQMRHAAYWACFHADAPLDDRPKDSTYTVSVPKQNLLTVEALHGLFSAEFRADLVTS